MKVSDEQAQTLREEYGSGDFYEARVIYDLLTDREELLRFAADQEGRIEKLVRVVEAARKTDSADKRLTKTILSGSDDKMVAGNSLDLALDLLRDALRALDEES